MFTLAVFFSNIMHWGYWSCRGFTDLWFRNKKTWFEAPSAGRLGALQHGGDCGALAGVKVNSWTMMMMMIKIIAMPHQHRQAVCFYFLLKQILDSWRRNQGPQRWRKRNHGSAGETSLFYQKAVNSLKLLGYLHPNEWGCISCHDLNLESSHNENRF